MKASEAAAKLMHLIDELGQDVDLVCLTDVDGRFAIDYNRDFDIIELPDENGNLDNAIPVIAFMESPDPDQMEYPKLKAVK